MMDRRGQNKENNIPDRDMGIKNNFKVKKCLFKPSKNFSSPELSPPSSLLPTPPSAESPFDLYSTRKRRVPFYAATPQKCVNECSPLKCVVLSEQMVCSPVEEKKPFEQVEDFSEAMAISPLPLFSLKKKPPTKPSQLLNSSSQLVNKFQFMVDSPEHNDAVMESPASSSAVKRAVQNAVSDPMLGGDYKTHCVLPTINGRHPELKSITSETLADLLSSKSALAFKLIDCRYPYEYNGGHIMGSLNIFDTVSAFDSFFDDTTLSTAQEANEILIFYCEFSSERAPGMYRDVRNFDRSINEDRYPAVYYPEMYLLEGGYKAFFSNFKLLCEPKSYKPMLHKDHSFDLVRYRGICKKSSFKAKKNKDSKRFSAKNCHKKTVLPQDA